MGTAVSVMSMLCSHGVFYWWSLDWTIVVAEDSAFILDCIICRCSSGV